MSTSTTMRQVLTSRKLLIDWARNRLHAELKRPISQEEFINPSAEMRMHILNLFNFYPTSDREVILAGLKAYFENMVKNSEIFFLDDDDPGARIPVEVNEPLPMPPVRPLAGRQPIHYDINGIDLEEVEVESVTRTTWRSSAGIQLSSEEMRDILEEACSQTSGGTADDLVEKVRDLIEEHVRENLQDFADNAHFEYSDDEISDGQTINTEHRVNTDGTRLFRESQEVISRFINLNPGDELADSLTEMLHGDDDEV